MQEIIRDPLWQFVGAILALVAIALSILLPLIQRRSKRLSYEVISKTALLNIDKEITGRVEILLDGKPIKDVSLAVVKIINSGTVPIPANDYERPICLRFGNNARILSYEIIDRIPESLQPKIYMKDENEANVTLEPVLMNGGDSVSLKVLISEIEENIEVDGRIIGVREIDKVINYKRPSSRELLFKALCLLVGLILSLMAILAMVKDSASWNSLPSFLQWFFLISILLCFILACGLFYKILKLLFWLGG